MPPVRLAPEGQRWAWVGHTPYGNPAARERWAQAVHLFGAALAEAGHPSTFQPVNHRNHENCLHFHSDGPSLEMLLRAAWIAGIDDLVEGMSTAQL